MADGEDDAVLDVGGETGDLDGKGVGADGKAGEGVLAGGSGLGGLLVAGAVLLDGDGGSGDGGAAFILHEAAEARGGELREGGGGEAEKDEEEDERMRAAAKGARTVVLDRLGKCHGRGCRCTWNSLDHAVASGFFFVAHKEFSFCVTFCISFVINYQRFTINHLPCQGNSSSEIHGEGAEIA